jgi:transcriptional regulator with XRE-family HTH domain
MARGGVHPNSLAAQFIETLRRVRLARQLKVEQLAEITGFDQAGIKRWETGGSAPLLTNFIIYADALGFDVKLERREPHENP